VRVRLEWQPRDLWIGAYWERRWARPEDGPPQDRQRYRVYDLWVCALPCLPLHLRWLRLGAKEDLW